MEVPFVNRKPSSLCSVTAVAVHVVLVPRFPWPSEKRWF